MIDGLFIGILMALTLNVMVLWLLTVVFPNGGTLRQNSVLFVAQGCMGWRDFVEDVNTLIMADNAKLHMTPKQRMNGFLDSWIKETLEVK